MKPEEQIEINLADVVQKLQADLSTAQHDAAMRYAMCESLKRKIAELEAHAKAAAPAAGQ